MLERLQLRVFISSVQKELASERLALQILLTTDPWIPGEDWPRTRDQIRAKGDKPVTICARFALDLTEFCARFPSVLRFTCASFLSDSRFICNPILRFNAFRMRSILQGFALDCAFTCGVEIRHQQQQVVPELCPISTVDGARSLSAPHSQLARESCPRKPSRIRHFSPTRTFTWALCPCTHSKTCNFSLLGHLLGHWSG